ncbi:hypothetical protein [Synechococcus sp. CBW1107]|uniref:hypothetical protein n=1 Tax=Synechococcus sp. CBW1107 TaxID=2789857 RepID=UPI002AD3B2D1|nr:hypothetical protein [Synechococcus sp. CBW1107]
MTFTLPEINSGQMTILDFLNQTETSNTSTTWNQRNTTIRKLIKDYILSDLEYDYGETLEYVEKETSNWRNSLLSNRHNFQLVKVASYFARLAVLNNLLKDQISTDLRNKKCSFDKPRLQHKGFDIVDSLGSLRYKEYISSIDSAIGLKWRQSGNIIVDIGPGRAYLEKILMSTGEKNKFILIDSPEMLSNSAIELSNLYNNISFFCNSIHTFMQEDFICNSVYLLPFSQLDQIESMNDKVFVFSTQILAGLPKELELNYGRLIKKHAKSFFIENTTLDLNDLGLSWSQYKSGWNSYNDNYIVASR